MSVMSTTPISAIDVDPHSAGMALGPLAQPFHEAGLRAMLHRSVFQETGAGLQPARWRGNTAGPGQDRDIW